MSSVALSERVMERDMVEWSRSTTAVGTFSGSPSSIRSRKKKVISTGTSIMPAKYILREHMRRTSRLAVSMNPVFTVSPTLLVIDD